MNKRPLIAQHSFTHTLIALAITGAVAAYVRFTLFLPVSVAISLGSITGAACITIKEIRDFQKPQSERKNGLKDFLRNPRAFDWAGWVLPCLVMALLHWWCVQV